VVAQDVLYRFVDIRTGRCPRLSHIDAEDQLKHRSGISLLSWTISQKPQLAAKVKRLWWWPQSKFVLHHLSDSALSPFTGDWNIYIDEKQVASELLTQLTELEDLTFVVREGSIYYQEDPWDHGKAMFAYMGLRQDKLTSIAGLAKLKSPYFGHCLLDWAVVALPNLRTLELGDSAMVELPTHGSTAPNITSLVIGNCTRRGSAKMSAIMDLLRRLPSLGSLRLRSLLKYENMQHPS
jgi:hypothetical protein